MRYRHCGFPRTINVKKTACTQKFRQDFRTRLSKSRQVLEMSEKNECGVWQSDNHHTPERKELKGVNQKRLA